jgi:imidazolonepropionase-like amidohydrolase
VTRAFLSGALAAIFLAQLPARTVMAISTALDGRGGVIRDTRLVIQDGRIAAIDPNASPIDIDLRDRVVMPGWIDTHVHLNWHFDDKHASVSGGDPPEQAALFTAEDAWMTLQGGFTTVQSLGAAIDGVVRDRINRGVLPGPRVLTSLRHIQSRNGDPDALRALVRQTKQDGADAIKLFATSGLGAGDDDRRADRGGVLGGEGAGAARRGARHRRQARRTCSCSTTISTTARASPRSRPRRSKTSKKGSPRWPTR